jgi:putative transposase
LYLKRQIALVPTLRLRLNRRHGDAPLTNGPGQAVAKKKRHSRAEIATKLAQANDLATQGKLQSEIARTLGVSVMTLHRWRKAPPGPQTAFFATHEAGQPDRTRGGRDRIAELQLENSRLRRLVTDLLLEKIVLEEATQNQKSRRNGRR